MIVDVDGLITVADYKAFYEYVLKKIPFLHKNRQWLDDSGKALSRFFYKPSFHPDREQYIKMSITHGCEPVSFKEYEDYILELRVEDEKILGIKKETTKLNGKHKHYPQNETNEHEVKFNLTNYFDTNCRGRRMERHHMEFEKFSNSAWMGRGVG